MRLSNYRTPAGVSICLAAALAGLGAPVIALATTNGLTNTGDAAITLMGDETYIQVEGVGASFPVVEEISSDVNTKLNAVLVTNSGDGAESAPLTNATWKSSDESILTVDQDGTIHGQGKPGYVALIVEDGNGHTARVPFKVSTPEQLLEAMFDSLPSQCRYSNATEYVIDRSYFAGKTSTSLSAHLEPECSFSTFEVVEASAKIEDESIATAVYDGILINLDLKHPGETKLTLTVTVKSSNGTTVSGSRSYPFKVTSDVDLDCPFFIRGTVCDGGLGTQVVSPKTPCQLRALAYQGNEVPNPPVDGITWRSSDTNVLSVSADGTIQFTGNEGIVTVTAAKDGHEAYIVLNVSNGGPVSDPNNYDFVSAYIGSGSNVDANLVTYESDGNGSLVYTGKTAALGIVQFDPRFTNEPGFDGYLKVDSGAIIASSAVVNRLATEKVVKSAQYSTSDSDVIRYSDGKLYFIGHGTADLTAAIKLADGSTVTRTIKVTVPEDLPEVFLSVNPPEEPEGTEPGDTPGSGDVTGPGGGSEITPTPEPDVVTNPDGSVTTTVTAPDGSTTSATVTAGGTEVVVEAPASGGAGSVSATVSAADAAAGAVALPVPGGLAPGQGVSVSVPVGGATVVVPVAGGARASSALELVGADGSATVLPKVALSEGGLAVALGEGATLRVAERGVPFPDVSGSEWFAEQGVSGFVSSRGIMTGDEMPDGTLAFHGGEPTNRAMFVTMLHRLELEPEAASGAPFDDVAGGEWYAAAAAWGDEAGVVAGYGDGSVFGGGDPVTREQMAVFMYRYAGWLGLDVSARAELDAPDAASVSGWASEAMSWAVAEGLFTGDDATGALRPTDGATRAEAAAVIMRLVNDVLY